jgi:hypothetical protein
MMMLGYAAPWLLMWMCWLVFDPSYRAAHPGLAQIVNLRSLWLIILYSLFFVTAGFAFAERFKLKSWLLKDWNPRKLPAVRDPNRISRSDSTAELATSVLYITLCLNFVSSATILNVADVRVTLAPFTRTFIWVIFFLSFTGTGVAAANLFRPYWTRFRASLRLAIDAIGWSVLCWLLRVSPLLEIDAPNLSVEGAARLTGMINSSMCTVFWFVLAAGAVVVFVDVRRIVRAKPTRLPPPPVSLQSPYSQLW